MVQAFPKIIQKDTPQDNRWFSPKAYRKIKSEEKIAHDNNPPNLIFSPLSADVLDVQEKNIYRTVDAVKKAGFNLVTTANNHILDMGIDGAHRTVDILKEKKLDFIGSYHNAKDKTNSLVKVVEKDGIRMVFLAYTYGANRFKTEQLMSEKLSHLTSLIVWRESPVFETVLADVQERF